MLTGLTARTGLLRVLERPLTSTVVPFPKPAPLQTLLLLTDKDLYRRESNEVVPTACRSVWDLTLRDIWNRAGWRRERRPVLKAQTLGMKFSSFMSGRGRSGSCVSSSIYVLRNVSGHTASSI